MDAGPLLAEVGRRLNDAHLDAVLIGNAAAALQGAPVTTVDLDFMFRRTARNLAKLKTVAAAWRATILRPYYPASDLYRVVRDEDGLQVDFMPGPPPRLRGGVAVVTIHGVRSFERLKSRAACMEIDGASVLVAALEDIIRSKRAARRPRDLAVLEILERTLAEATKSPSKAGGRPARK